MSTTQNVRLSTLLREKRDEILRIAAKHGARNIRVFGSVVRGEDGPESDLDLLVHFDEGRSLLDHAALMLELQRALGRDVDIASDEGLKERVRERILSEAVSL